MQKLKNKITTILAVLAAVCAFLLLPLNAAAETDEVYLGGMPAGFTLGNGGAQIVGICEVLTENGVQNPAKDAGLEVGDVIVSLGGIRIETAADIDAALSSCGGKSSSLTIERGSEKLKKEIAPVKDMASGS